MFDWMCGASFGRNRCPSYGTADFVISTWDIPNLSFPYVAQSFQIQQERSSVGVSFGAMPVAVVPVTFQSSRRKLKEFRKASPKRNQKILLSFICFHYKCLLLVHSSTIHHLCPPSCSILIAFFFYPRLGITDSPAPASSAIRSHQIAIWSFGCCGKK
ncbi:hypothetical protein P8452_11128 [Trifolium repens]|nr:hypothetical protein P8452_11128 [Trifolium repens]